MFRITEFKALGPHIKCTFPAVHVINRPALVPVASHPGRTFSFSASRRQIRCQGTCFPPYLLLPIFSHFSLLGCCGASRMAALLFRLLDYPVGIPSTLTRHRHGPSALTRGHLRAVLGSSRFPDKRSFFRCHAVSNIHGGTRNSLLSSAAASPEVTLRFDEVDRALGQMLDVNTENGFACGVLAHARFLRAHRPLVCFLLSRSRVERFVPDKSV